MKCIVFIIQNHFDLLHIYILFLKGDGIKFGSLTEDSYKPVTTTDIGEVQTAELVNWLLTVVSKVAYSSSLSTHLAWGWQAPMFSYDWRFKSYVATV